MRRHALIVIAGAVVTWTFVANNLPAAQPPGADWTRPASIEAGGLTAYYPRTWTASVEESTITIRAGDTRIMLVDHGTTSAGFPTRPDRFTLENDDRRFLSCLGFEGWNVTFTDHSQLVQAFVKLGPGTRESDAAEVLDRLVIG